MADAKGSSLSAMAIVSAVEWPVYELISGRLPGDGSPESYSVDAFYRQFAPTWTDGDGHTYQVRYRMDAGVGVWFLAAGQKTIDGLHTNASNMFWDKNGEPNNASGMTPGSAIDPTQPYVNFTTIRESLSALHAVSPSFTTDFATMAAPSSDTTDLVLNGTPDGDTKTAMLNVLGMYESGEPWLGPAGAVTVAKAIFDGVDCVDEVAGAVMAREQRTRPAHLRELGRLRAAMCGTGQVHTTQFFAVLQSAETARLAELADIEQRLVMGREAYRKQVLEAALEQIVSLQMVDMGWAQSLVKAALYEYQVRAAADHDKFELDLHGLKANALWDLEIDKYAWQAISVLNGAPLVPRPMTNNQRIAAAVTNGFSTGVQVGGATGNVVLGGVAAVASIAAQLIGMN